MNVKEEDFYRLGEALEAQTSVLESVLIYDENLETRDYSKPIENLYKKCLTDYKTSKNLLEQNEDQSNQINSFTSETSVVLEEDNTSWVRLEYSKLGEKLLDAVETHQENLQNTETQTGRERLEAAVTEYESLAWSIPPSYILSLEHVELPPREKDGSEIIEEAQIIK